MTVIVGVEYGGEIAMAADGRCSVSSYGIMNDGFAKICEPEDGFFVGIAGTVGFTNLAARVSGFGGDPQEYCELLLGRIIEAGAEPGAESNGCLPAYCLEGVIASAHGLWTFDGTLSPCPVEPHWPACAGSGSPEAAAAVLSILDISRQLTAGGLPAGLTAESICRHAIKVATTLDSSCGGRVQTAVVPKHLGDNVLPFTPTPAS
jgi:ATP-dependent protease HslVU (ClpYQ) peptidase subunit